MSDALALGYHAVSEDWPAALSTTPARFEAQVKLLQRRGYRGVTFAELVAGERGTRGKRVAFTFDDAYSSVLRLAKPLLDQAGFPGTVFVPTDFPGRAEPMSWPGIDHWLGGPHEAELLPLSWQELRALAEEGWEVGSHTCSHPRLTALGDSELDAELRLSKERCSEAVGRECLSLAYPYGDWDRRVSLAAQHAGYQAAAILALSRVLQRPKPLEWPRVGVYGIDSSWRFRLKVSPALRQLRREVF